MRPRPGWALHLYLFLGLSFESFQWLAASANALLWSRSGLSFLTFAISDFMNTLYADGSRGALSPGVRLEGGVAVIRGARAYLHERARTRRPQHSLQHPKGWHVK